MSDPISLRPGMELRTVELPAPDGVIRGKVGITRGPMRLAGLVPTACQLTDALVERAIRVEQEVGRTVSCRAGCGACCRHMVPISPPEAFYVVDALDSFEPERRQAVVARFDQIGRVLDERRMVDELLDPEVVNQPVLPVARQYFALGLPCPFLVDESCSIHPHRPIACRDYNVTSPAAWCARPYEREVAKVPMPLPLSVPLARLTGTLTREKPCLIPLALVPRWVGARGELRAREWPGPTLFDRFLDELRSQYGSTADDS